MRKKTLKKKIVCKAIKTLIVLIVILLCMIGMVQYKRTRLNLQNKQQRYSVTLSITNNSNDEIFPKGKLFLHRGLEVVDEFLEKTKDTDDIVISCSTTYDWSGYIINYVLISDSGNERFISISKEFDEYITDELDKLVGAENGYIQKQSEMDYIAIARLRNSEVKYGLLGALMGLCLGLAVLNLGELFFAKYIKKR